MFREFPQQRRTLLALAALVGLYFALGSAYAAAAPAFEKPDEEWHFAYVAYLLDKGSLPPISSDESINPARQEAGQPPLYYLMAAAAARILRLDTTRPPLRPNPYWAYPAPGTVNDNKNRFVHARGELASEDFRAVFWLRYLSLALGGFAVVSAYGLARAMGGSRAAGLASATVAATLPQYLFIASSVSNDGLVTALSGAALWALLVAARRESSTRSWIIFGALAGLAALTKTSALIISVTGVASALAVGLWRRSARTAMAGTLASSGSLLIVTGWWYARNVLLYGDPLGLGIHFTEIGRSQALTLESLIGQWQAVETSFWAAFGWGNVLLPDWAYWGFRVVELSALVGLAMIGIKTAKADDETWARWIAAFYVAAVFAGLIWWTRAVSASLGRLLFPALAPLAALMVIGWARLWKRLPIIVVGWMSLWSLLAPLYIVGAYQPPPMRAADELLPAARLTRIDFGGLARLVAFDISPARLSPGQTVNMTLCWEALNTTPTDYSIFVHLLGPANTILGGRETYPGLGSYATSLWNRGDKFCDQYSVPVARDARGPAVAAVEVGVFDLGTGNRLAATDDAGNLFGLVVIDQVKILGPGAEIPPSAKRLDADFGDPIALSAYEIGAARAGATVPVTLYWQARAQPADDYTVFVHVLDSAGQIVAQSDSQPQTGSYPTRWWDVGETVIDPRGVLLPADLPRGDYRVIVGLYLAATGERLTLAASGGDSIELVSFTIK
ncbi:MAG: DUF2142 domain-containing protein [Chloroflexota bacterium]